MKNRMLSLILIVAGLGLLASPYLLAVNQIVLNVKIAPSYQYDFYGTAPPNTALGLVRFDGVNTWTLTTQTVSDVEGNFLIRMAFSAADVGTEHTFRIHNSGATMISNEVTIVVGEDPNVTPPLPPETFDLVTQAAGISLIGLGLFTLYKKRKGGK